MWTDVNLRDCTVGSKSNGEEAAWEQALEPEGDEPVAPPDPVFGSPRTVVLDHCYTPLCFDSSQVMSGLLKKNSLKLIFYAIMKICVNLLTNF